MRAGGCTLQQSLTAESATLVKQSIGVARRRGHAQVTPLHVASTMLSTSTGLLRAACLHSHSHPLQCKALELCFNVALNRLPASTTTSLLGHTNQYLPVLSNALVAAFKRAQAHQRRGSIETQQQPLLAVKIELEQLVISILDDPSVSRVMREAGFSSTQVKSNVEQAVEISASSSPDDVGGDRKPTPDCRRKEGNLVVVGDCLGTTDRNGTVMRCKVGNPSLQTLSWALNPLTIPVGNLGLSLSLGHETDENSYFCNRDERQHVIRSAPTNLPPWLQQYKDTQECSNWKKKKKKTENSTDCCSGTPINSSSFSSEESYYYQHRFKEVNAENLKNLCTCLEKKVPWQMDIIPEISTTILQCRSGMATRWKNNSIQRSKEDTWLLFQGHDVEGKRILSKELASVVFGSDSCFVSVGRTRRDDTDNDDSWNYKKRLRSESWSSSTTTYIDRFAEAVDENPHRVFLLEDVDEVDRDCKIQIKNAIETGSVHGSGFLEDAIVILCCDTLGDHSSPGTSDGCDKREEEEETTTVCLDLNLSAGDYSNASGDFGLVELVDSKFYFKLRQH